MGLIANQMAAELLTKFVDKIKQRKENNAGVFGENHEFRDNRTNICKGFSKDF